MAVRIGSLFSGAGGFDMAIEAVFGGRTVFHCEPEKIRDKDTAPWRDNPALTVLSARQPGVPNLGDITAVDWADVEPVDVLCGGFPCQDISAAGLRAGMGEGTRSGLWSEFARAIDALRPRYVAIENVRNLLNNEANRAVEFPADALGDNGVKPVLRALGAVLGDLSDIGYDAQWCTIAASDIGSCHRRERVFILAHPAGNVRPWLNDGPSGATARSGRQRFVTGGIGNDSRALDLLPTPAASRSGNNQSPSRAAPGSQWK